MFTLAAIFAANEKQSPEDKALMLLSFGAFLLLFLAWKAFIILKRPDVYAQQQQQDHARRTQAIGIVGTILCALLGRR
jgi:hypothetical protein